eukprot:1704193-Prymnesium_polylepis.1
MVHIFARPHHHDEPLASEARDVRALQVAPGVERAVDRELVPPEKPLQCQCDSRSNVGMLHVTWILTHRSSARRSACGAMPRRTARPCSPI